MGLDMHVFKTKAKPDKEVGFSLPEGSEEICYWRKHPDLHGWMENLYRRKGGKEDMFNCEPVVLTLQDLMDLKESILNESLPKTSGFFFGNSDNDLFQKTKDLEFIELAKMTILEGYTVYYDSSW